MNGGQQYVLIQRNEYLRKCQDGISVAIYCEILTSMRLVRTLSFEDDEAVCILLLLTVLDVVRCDVRYVLKRSIELPDVWLIHPRACKLQ